MRTPVKTWNVVEDDIATSRSDTFQYFGEPAIDAFLRRLLEIEGRRQKDASATRIDRSPGMVAGVLRRRPVDAFDQTASFIVALIAGSLFVMLVGVLMERLIIRYFYARPQEDQILVTTGIRSRGSGSVMQLSLDDWD